MPTVSFAAIEEECIEFRVGTIGDDFGGERRVFGGADESEVVFELVQFDVGLRESGVGGFEFGDALPEFLVVFRKSAAFTEYDVSADPKFRDEMTARSNGGMTFPQIFIDKVHIGGCDELYGLDRDGKLDGMLFGHKAAGQKVSS